MEIEDLQKLVIKFRDSRDWKKFHNPKDVSLSLVLEAVEVMEHFQWKNGEEMSEYLIKHKEKVGDELADVLYWILLLSNDLEIDITEAFNRKMDTNEKKYPVKKAKGSNKKYTDL